MTRWEIMQTNATNANDYCESKFIISFAVLCCAVSPMSFAFFSSFRLHLRRQSERRDCWRRFFLRFPSLFVETNTEFICEWMEEGRRKEEAKALFNDWNKFRCQDSTSAITEIFMMFTQVYGSFSRSRECLRLQTRSPLIVFQRFETNK